MINHFLKAWQQSDAAAHNNDIAQFALDMLVDDSEDDIGRGATEWLQQNYPILLNNES